MFTEEHGRFLAELESIRKEIIENVPNESDRKALLGELVDDESFEYFRTNGPEAWRERAQDMIKASRGEGLTFRSPSGQVMSPHVIPAHKDRVQAV